MASGDSMFLTIWYWFSTLLAWESIIFFGVAYSGYLEKDLKSVSLAILIVTILVYYVSEFCSSSCKYLCRRSEAAGIYKYMEKMFYTPMHKVMHIQCYHYQTHSVTTQDSDGNTTTSTTTTRVNTHSASERYYYISWRDISGKFNLDVSGGLGQREKPFVKLHLSLAMKLAEDGTEADFHNQKRSFIDRNNRDDHYDYYEKLELRDYNPKNDHTLVRVTDFNPPCFSYWWFILFTLLTVAEFYKIYMDKYCTVQKFTIVKVVSSRQDLNAPQYVQEYVTSTPSIIYMGNVKQYDGPMLLSQGEFCPPPENMKSDMNPSMEDGIPGRSTIISAPLLPNEAVI